MLVVYEINKQVLPTAPSPTTTHLHAHNSISGCILSLRHGGSVLDGSDNHFVFRSSVEAILVVGYDLC